MEEVVEIILLLLVMVTSVAGGVLRYYILKGKEDEGKAENQQETAKKMLAKGIDINLIMEITELTKDEIEEIIKNN